MRTLLLVMAGLAVVIALLFGLVVFGGFAPVAATERHWGPVEWTLETAMHNAVRRHARQVEAPNLDDAALREQGARLYDEMCVGCHAAPGKRANEELVEGLYPHPPELAKVTSDRTPEELYWVTKHGLKLTGMPAWGPTHNERQLWAMAAFMRTMHTTTPEEYQALTTSPAQLSRPAPQRHDHGEGSRGHRH